MSAEVAAPAAPKSLVSKLAEVMAAVERVAKRGHNDFHNYDYATEADIASAIRKELADRQVMLVPAIESYTREPVGEKGSALTTLVMSFTFLDGETGQELKRSWLGAGTDKEDKGLYKAMTGGEKYFLLKTFLIPTGDDPERETNGGQPRRQARDEKIGDPARPQRQPGNAETEREVMQAFPDGIEGEVPDLREQFKAGNLKCICGHKVLARKDGTGWFCWIKRGGCGREWKVTPTTASGHVIDVETGEVTRPRDPVVIEAERKALMLKVKKLADAIGLDDKGKRDAWKTYCGVATESTVDPAALQDLIKWLETRAVNKGVAVA